MLNSREMRWQLALLLWAANSTSGGAQRLAAISSTAGASAVMKMRILGVVVINNQAWQSRAGARP